MRNAQIRLQDGTWSDVSDVTTDKIIFVGRHNGKSQKTLEQLIDYYSMNKIYAEEELNVVTECDKKENWKLNYPGLLHISSHL